VRVIERCIGSENDASSLAFPMDLLTSMKAARRRIGDDLQSASYYDSALLFEPLLMVHRLTCRTCPAPFGRAPAAVENDEESDSDTAAAQAETVEGSAEMSLDESAEGQDATAMAVDGKTQ